MPRRPKVVGVKPPRFRDGTWKDAMKILAAVPSEAWKTRARKSGQRSWRANHGTRTRLDAAWRERDEKESGG